MQRVACKPVCRLSPFVTRVLVGERVAGSFYIGATDRLDIITDNSQGHRISGDWPLPWALAIVNEALLRYCRANGIIGKPRQGDGYFGPFSLWVRALVKSTRLENHRINFTCRFLFKVRRAI